MTQRTWVNDIPTNVVWCYSQAWTVMYICKIQEESRTTARWVWAVAPLLLRVIPLPDIAWSDLFLTGHVVVTALSIREPRHAQGSIGRPILTNQDPSTNKFELRSAMTEATFWVTRSTFWSQEILLTVHMAVPEEGNFVKVKFLLSRVWVWRGGAPMIP